MRHGLQVAQRRHGAHARLPQVRAAELDRQARWAARSAWRGSWQEAQDSWPEADSAGSKNSLRPSAVSACARAR